MNLLRGTKIKKKKINGSVRNFVARIVNIILAEEREKKKEDSTIVFCTKTKNKKKKRKRKVKSIGSSRFILLMRGGERDKGDKACFQTSILNSRGRGWSAEAFRLVKGLQTRELEK